MECLKGAAKPVPHASRKTRGQGKHDSGVAGAGCHCLVCDSPEVIQVLRDHSTAFGGGIREHNIVWCFYKTGHCSHGLDIVAHCPELFSKQRCPHLIKQESQALMSPC